MYKKLISAMLIIALCVGIVPMSAFAADTTNPKDVAEKHQYLVLEEFDKSDFSAEATVDNFQSNACGYGTAKVTDKGKTVDVPYTVSAFTFKEKSSYYLDDIFQVICWFTDYKGVKTTLKQEEYSSKGLVTSTVGEHTGYLEFKGRSFPLTYTVLDSQIESIKFVAGTFQLRYFENDYLNAEGAKLQCLWSGGRKTTADVAADMISNFDSTTPGQKMMTITYRGMTCEVPYVVEPAPLDMVIDYSTFASEYKVGDTFKAGQTVEVTYSDWTTKQVPVTLDMVTGFSTTTSGRRTMTIRMGEVARTIEYNVTNVVSSIEVVSGSIPTTVNLNSSLSLASAKLKLIYVDKTYDTIPITLDMVTGFTSATEGAKTLTVTYQGKTAYYSYTVEDYSKPTLTLYYDEDSWETSEVDIKINAGGSFNHVRLPDGDTTTRTSYTYRVTENGTYTFKLDSNRGDITKSVSVNTIDNTAPNVTINLSSGNATLTATDSGSGIRRVVLQDGSTLTGSSFNNRALSMKSGTITVTDKAGNETSYAMSIHNDIVFTYNKRTPNQIQVMASNIESISLGNEVRNFNGNNIVQTFSNVQGLSFVFNIKDMKGNEYEYSLVASGKDTTAPTVVFTQSGNKVYWYVIDESTITSVKVNDVSSSLRNGSVNLYSGGKLTIYARDSYGNSTTEVYNYGDSGDYSFKIEVASTKGYIKGFPDNTFRPDSNVTRAELVTMVARLLKGSGTYYPKVTYTEGNRDWWYQSMAKCSSLGALTNMFLGASFDPSKPVTRLEVATILYNVVNTAGVSTTSKFSDTSNSIVVAVSNAGLLNGYPDGTFRPYNNITRAELVTMLNGMVGDKLLSSSTSRNPKDIAKHWAEAAIKKSLSDS